jgi:anthranilate phosphoribosyltransferase
VAADIGAGIGLARTAIADGRARAKLDAYVAYTRRLVELQDVASAAG